MADNLEITSEDISLLKRIDEYETTMNEDQKKMGWEWRDINTPTNRILRLLFRGLVTNTYCSTKHKAYMMNENGHKVMESQNNPNPELRITDAIEPILIPEDIFEDIVGFDSVKELIRESLLADKPIHILLHGPPALSKTMFLSDIERILGDKTIWLLGSGSSKSGMWDMIAEKQPRVILIDELEKMPLTDMAGLLSLMEKGRITRVKVGRRLDVQLDVWVVASANAIHRLPAELKSRFKICTLNAYNTTDFVAVVKNVLIRREGMSEDDARKVAVALIGKSHDVRDAIRIARLARRVGTDKAVELLVET